VSWSSGASRQPDVEGGFPASGGNEDEQHPGSGWSGTRAPVLLLVLAASLEAVGLVLGVRAVGRPYLAAVGWAVGGLLPITTLMGFMWTDTRRRASGWYTSGPMPGRIRQVLLVGVLAVVVLNALHFADWASRQ
jgi:hypothetical protein